MKMDVRHSPPYLKPHDELIPGDWAAAIFVELFEELEQPQPSGGDILHDSNDGVLCSDGIARVADWGW